MIRVALVALPVTRYRSAQVLWDRSRVPSSRFFVDESRHNSRTDRCSVLPDRPLFVPVRRFDGEQAMGGRMNGRADSAVSIHTRCFDGRCAAG